MRVIVSSLIDRLAEYAARADGNGASVLIFKTFVREKKLNFVSSQAISEDAQVFNAFYACVNQLAAERPTMLPADLCKQPKKIEIIFNLCFFFEN